MYALHPELSLPPQKMNGPRERFTAKQLAAYYKLESWEYIVWPADPDAEGLSHQDFIHLYPMYYGRYMLKNRHPEMDVPCNYVSEFSGAQRGGKASRQSGAATCTPAKRKPR